MIDLHMHSRWSDGSDTPTELVALAARAGCRAIALTDHDIVDGVPEAIAAGERLGIDVIGGVELSAHVSDRPVHLLGYFVGPHPGRSHDFAWWTDT